MKRHCTLVLAAVALLTTACSQAPAPASSMPDTREADAKALRDLEDAWNQEYVQKDAAKAAAHYSDDAVLVAPGMSVKGSAEIAKTLTGMVADPAMALKFHADRIEVSKSGDLAYTQGTYTMTSTDPKTKKPATDKGKYVTVYKKVDGTWKAVQDIASSDMPPMPMK